MANTKITADNITDGAITSAKLDTNIAVAGTLGVTGDITGTLATAAQPNITSVGTLTALDVSATTPIINLQDSNGSGNAATPYLQYKDSGGTDLGYVGYGSSGNSTLTIANIANDNIDFLTNGEQSLRINSLGNVGIGASTVDAKLHIEVSSGDANLKLEDGSATYMLLDQNSIGGSDVIRFKTGGSLDERMRIDSNGNVGIRNASPASLNSLGGDSLVIGDGTETQNLFLYSATNEYGHIAFADSNANGSSAQYAGLIQYYHGDNSMRFYTNSAERMRVTSGGDFVVANTAAVGTWYNGGSIGFGYSSGGYGAMVRAGTNTPFYVSTTGSGSGGFIEFSQGTTSRGTISFNGSVMVYGGTSDYRLKENVTPITNAITKINNLNPVNFDWIDSGVNSEGFLAHEAQTVVPYAVTGVKDEVYTDENSGEEKLNGEPKYQEVDYGKLTPLLVKAIQEQQALIESLTARLETLENA